MKFTHIGMMFALVGAPGLAMAQQQQPPMPGHEGHTVEQHQQLQQQLSQTERKTVAKLHKSNQKEIQAAQIGVERAQSPEVREFAQQVLRDHQQNDQRLMQMAQERGISLTMPGERTEKQRTEEWRAQQQLAQLQQAEGAEFDRQFLQLMAESHGKSANMLRQARQNVEDPAVSSIVRQSLPVIQRHEMRANSLRRHIEQQQQIDQQQQQIEQQQQQPGEQGTLYEKRTETEIRIQPQPQPQPEAQPEPQPEPQPEQGY